jgi:hypothetical protein
LTEIDQQTHTQSQLPEENYSEQDYSPEELRYIDYGDLGYDIEAIAKIEGKYPQQIEDRMQLIPSLKLLYDKSVAQSKYTMDLKIFNLAMSGDLKALEMHRDRIVRDRLNKSRTP